MECLWNEPSGMYWFRYDLLFVAVCCIRLGFAVNVFFRPPTLCLYSCIYQTGPSDVYGK